MTTGEKQYRRIYAGFGGAFTLLVALLGFALLTVARLADALERNMVTYGIIDNAATARASVELILAGYGGFMFAQSDDALDLMERGEQGYEAALDELETATAGDSAQQARIAQARALNDEWREQYRLPSIASIRQLTPETTLVFSRAIAEAEGRRFQTYTSDIYGLLDGIRRHEEANLAQRTERVQGLKRTAFFLIVLGGLIGVCAAAAFAFLGIVRSRALVRANQSLRQEVEERQRAEHALERVSKRNAMILAAAGEGICGLDTDGRIIFMNPAAGEMLQVDPDAVMLRAGAAVLYGVTGASASFTGDHSIYRSLGDGSVHHMAVDTFRRNDGMTFPVEHITRPIVEDGQITGCVLTFQDISERRAVEKLKDEFVSVVSHELRTPLTSIRGSLGLLASGMLGTLHERGQRMLEIAAQNTDRLVRLINDILDIERIESGTVTMNPRQTDANRLIQQAMGSVQGFAERSGIEVQTQPTTASVWADSDRIVQVLTNLLSNAIKFSDPGAEVRVTAVEDGEMLRFTVSDRGRGIPQSKLRSIFERFQQVDASDSREKGGTGLGLAIARSIVLQHGGDIWVDSEVGVGSRFIFTLPLLGIAPDREDRSSPTILLCDDDDITLAVVGEKLRDQGYHVITVGSGEEAIEAARDREPDAILLDLVMPGMDGCETMVRLKAQRETRDIPIIIFSSTPQVNADVLAGGATDWVSKDAGEESLLKALDRALHRGTRISRVLLVEDDVDLAEVLTTMFEAHGVETLHADSYADAVRLARSAPPDLLIVDIVLREGDAYELVDCLRRDDQLRSVPLVVYSAMDLDDAQRNRLRLGPTEFMTKGRVSPSDFEQRVVGLLDELFMEEGVPT